MRRVALFARAPLPGLVKTRLSPALPAPLAAAVYAGLLADAVRAMAEAHAEERLVYWAGSAGAVPRVVVSRRQRGEGLGERLAAAFDDLLAAPGDTALVLGSDTPALTSAHVDEACEALDRHDVVLGPTGDGGYWCVGLARGAPELFGDIPWSTDRALATTLARAREAGLSVALVSPLDDLDTPRDLARLVGSLAAGRAGCGANTRAALVAAGLVPQWSVATSGPAAARSSQPSS